VPQPAPPQAAAPQMPAPQVEPVQAQSPAPAPASAPPALPALDAVPQPGTAMPPAPAVDATELGPIAPEYRNADPDVIAALQQVLFTGASDLHITANAAPMLRVDGGLSPVAGASVWGPEKVRSALVSLLSPDQLARFEEHLELDLAYTLSASARFRVNMYQQRGAIGAAFRLIPTTIKTLEQLGVPETVGRFATLPRGLVLVTGPTGSGKSTTLAALIDLVNRTRADHIVTVEDPIEFMHGNKRSLVNQREVGADTHSFANALKHVLRQDPDVILVGEMRDMETIGTALHAAETGHMVFSTLHTLDAVETINRIIAVFPPPEQKQIRLQLAAVVRAVISQRLVRRCDADGRVPAVEVMINTAYIRECILVPEKTRSIRDAISAGTSQYGMQTFDQSLWDLFQAGLINYETALDNASNADDFKLRMQGISSTSDASKNAMQAAGFGGR